MNHQSVFRDTHKSAAKSKRRKGKLHMGYHWVHHAPIEGLVLFKYNPSRSKKVPEARLQEYNRTIQTDGYSGYLNRPPKEVYNYWPVWHMPDAILRKH